MRQRRRRGVLANDARRHVQVVVVEEHRRLGLSLELLEHDLGEVAVHGAIAVTPGNVEPLIDARSAREAPEVVLEKPQHRVGDDVVVTVVRRRVVDDEPQPVGRPVGGGLVQRLAVSLLRHLPVRVGDGTCHPRHVVVAHEAPEGGHEPAAAAPGNAISVCVAVEGDGAAVGDDDQLPAADHRSTVPGGTQSGVPSRGWARPIAAARAQPAQRDAEGGRGRFRTQSCAGRAVAAAATPPTRPSRASCRLCRFRAAG